MLEFNWDERKKVKRLKGVEIFCKDISIWAQRPKGVNLVRTANNLTEALISLKSGFFVFRSQSILLLFLLKGIKYINFIKRLALIALSTQDEIKSYNWFKLYENLSLVRRYPEMWLTSKSISALSNYLHPYLVWGTKNYDYKSIYNDGDPDFRDFKDWMNKQYNFEIGVAGPMFHKVLLKETKNDEEKAFDRFFEKLDEFFYLNEKEPYII